LAFLKRFAEIKWFGHLTINYLSIFNAEEKSAFKWPALEKI